MACASEGLNRCYFDHNFTIPLHCSIFLLLLEETCFVCRTEVKWTYRLCILTISTILPPLLPFLFPLSPVAVMCSVCSTWSHRAPASFCRITGAQHSIPSSEGITPKQTHRTYEQPSGKWCVCVYVFVCCTIYDHWCIDPPYLLLSFSTFSWNISYAAVYVYAVIRLRGAAWVVRIIGRHSHWCR